MIIGSKKLSRIMLSQVVLISLALTVCTAQMSTTGMPQVKIIEPKEGDQIPAGNITVMANATNFSLVNKLGQASVAGSVRELILWVFECALDFIDIVFGIHHALDVSFYFLDLLTDVVFNFLSFICRVLVHTRRCFGWFYGCIC